MSDQKGDPKRSWLSRKGTLLIRRADRIDGSPDPVSLIQMDVFTYKFSFSVSHRDGIPISAFLDTGNPFRTGLHVDLCIGPTGPKGQSVLGYYKFRVLPNSRHFPGIGSIDHMTVWVDEKHENELVLTSNLSPELQLEYPVVDYIGHLYVEPVGSTGLIATSSIPEQFRCLYWDLKFLAGPSRKKGPLGPILSKDKRQTMLEFKTAAT